MPLTKLQLVKLRMAPIPPTGNRLALAIDMSGETQTTIGKRIGVPHTYVSDLSRGRLRERTITLKNAYRFSSYFGCQIEDLFPAREERDEIAS